MNSVLCNATGHYYTIEENLLSGFLNGGAY